MDHSGERQHGNGLSEGQRVRERYTREEIVRQVPGLHERPGRKGSYKNKESRPWPENQNFANMRLKRNSRGSFNEKTESERWCSATPQVRRFRDV